MIHASRPGD